MQRRISLRSVLPSTGMSSPHITPQIFQDKIFYFDVYNFPQKQKILWIEFLRTLGATVAEFFSKDVTTVITNRIEADPMARTRNAKRILGESTSHNIKKDEQMKAYKQYNCELMTLSHLRLLIKSKAKNIDERYQALVGEKKGLSQLVAEQSKEQFGLRPINQLSPSQIDNFIVKTSNAKSLRIPKLIVQASKYYRPFKKFYTVVYDMNDALKPCVKQYLNNEFPFYNPVPQYLYSPFLPPPEEIVKMTPISELNKIKRHQFKYPRLSHYYEKEGICEVCNEKYTKALEHVTGINHMINADNQFPIIDELIKKFLVRRPKPPQEQNSNQVNLEKEISECNDSPIDVKSEKLKEDPPNDFPESVEPALDVVVPETPRVIKRQINSNLFKPSPQADEEIDVLIKESLNANMDNIRASKRRRTEASRNFNADDVYLDRASKYSLRKRPETPTNRIANIFQSDYGRQSGRSSNKTLTPRASRDLNSVRKKLDL